MLKFLHIGRAGDLGTKNDRYLYRALEIMPGFLAWGTLALLVAFSFIEPGAVAIFIIVFDVYWLVKTVFLSLHMNASSRIMRMHMRRDWYRDLIERQPRSPDPRLSGLSWQDLYHVVILPISIEPLSVVRESFLSLSKIAYPLNRLIVVLAVEERVEGTQYIVQQIEQEFGKLFYAFLVTRHPDGLAGEMRGKGANIAWAGKQLKAELIDPRRIPHERLLVSVFDTDTVVPEQFFACLTWHFLSVPKPFRSSFQPIPIFTNNIWEAPSFARVFAFSTTFWQMIQQARPEQLVTFSSQSLSFQALVDVGFWQTNMVNEDSRIFWQCLLRYDGDWRTVPLYFPVYMDANVAPSFWRTAVNQYKQIRRWHYGVENNPYLLFGFLKNKFISRALKWRFGFTMVEKTHSAATNALIIFLLGWLPVIVGGSEFNLTILSYNLPQITSFIMRLAMFGLVSSAIISVNLLPPRPPNYGRLKWLWMVLQWLLYPINFVFFGALPALDAQTRLMVGAYLRFWVTPKGRRGDYSK